jgi:hypothetical protein
LEERSTDNRKAEGSNPLRPTPLLLVLLAQSFKNEASKKFVIDLLQKFGLSNAGKYDIFHTEFVLAVCLLSPERMVSTIPYAPSTCCIVNDIATSDISNHIRIAMENSHQYID